MGMQSFTHIHNLFKSISSISISLRPPLLPSYTSAWAQDAPPPRVLPVASGNVPASSLSWTWPVLTRPSHLLSCTCPRCSPAYQLMLCCLVHDLLPDAPCPCLHTQLTCIPALPNMVCTCTCTTAAVRHSVHHTGIRAEQPTARLAAGVPESADLTLARLGACYGPALKATHPHPHLEALQRQLTLYRTLELSANNTDMCVMAHGHAAPRSACDTACPPAHTGCALHAGAT